MDGIEKLFNRFPREIAPPRRIVNSMDEFYNWVNKHNGMKRDLFTTVNSYTNHELRDGRVMVGEKDIAIEKLFFDFDGLHTYGEVVKLHKFCMDKDVKHCVVFSGGGFHFYIFVRDNLIDKKSTVLTTQLLLSNKLNLHSDKQCLGDIRRITRIPNTYNFKRGKFCIPLSKEQLVSGIDSIRELANKQNFVERYIYGKKVLNIKHFDTQDRMFRGLPTNLSLGKDIKLNSDLPLPPCIKHMLKDKQPKWKERGWILLYLRDYFGLFLEESIDFLKKNITHQKFHHCMVDENNQPRYIYEREDLFFPSIQTFQQEGLCPFTSYKECGQHPYQNGKKEM
tara:strand:- start:11600 stop:12610 length:1011 start_codon:yes stop_codon:yes gene_type:complete